METVPLSEIAHFLPRQLEATKAADEHTYTLYGGSAGPGKSYWLRWYPIRTMMKWGDEYGLKGIHSALFSKDYTTLKDRQMSKMENEFPKWLGDIQTTKTDGLGFHLKPQYGGHVLLLRNLDDPSKYLSSEFAIVAQEEVTENDEDTFHKLRSRLRWTGIPNPKWIGATNPGGIGHSFCKKLWIDRVYPDELQPLAKEFVYVRALPKDNPYLSTSYLTTLDSLPEAQRKAYRDGNWDVFEGQYFTEWDEARHVEEPFAIPLTWFRYRSIDPSGREGVTSCHWYAVDSNGRVHAYREYYMTGRDLDEHAKAIAKLSQEADGTAEKYQYTVMDTSAFANAGYSETGAEIFERNGVTGLVPAAKERVIGWNAVHTYLRWGKDEAGNPHGPLLKVFSTCGNMIRTIPMAQHDEHHPEDVMSAGIEFRDKDGRTGTEHQDAIDELRYFLRTLREVKAPAPQTLVERKIAGLRRQHSGRTFDYQYRNR